MEERLPSATALMAAMARAPGPSYSIEFIKEILSKFIILMEKGPHSAEE
jgi:hypothetical protein